MNKKVLLFLGITFFITGLFDITSVFLKPSGQAGSLFITAAMWSPGIAAIVTKLIFKENLNELGWRWKTNKMLLWAFVIPIFYSLLSYIIIWSLNLGAFYNEKFVKSSAEMFGISNLSPFSVIIIFTLITGTIGLIKSCSMALGEEIGWRGFLTPVLFKKYGFIKTSLIVGSIWAVWHYTVLIFGEYNNEGIPLFFQLACFTTMIISLSFIYTYFTMKSGSLFPAMILHGTHNLYIQQILTPITENNTKSLWYVDEFGIVLPIITLLFAIYFTLKRNTVVNQYKINGSS